MIDDITTHTFIKEHMTCDIHLLALKANNYPNVDIKFAIQQIQARQIAAEKIPSWYANDNILFPKHLSLEQSSSELTAIYKADLVEGETFLDLTGGLGIDFTFLSQKFKKAIYVEQDSDLVRYAKHNFKVLNLQNIKIINDTAEKVLSYSGHVSTIYIDPARRNTNGKKTILIEDCTPNLLDISEQLDKIADQVIIKLSPMLDITDALNKLKNICEVHIISHRNECKELLFIRTKKEFEHPIFKCVNIKNSNERDEFIFSKSEEYNTSPLYTNTLYTYLYEPNTSILKAGAYKSLATKFDVYKLDINSHLYTSDQFETSFPGRSFEIISYHRFNKEGIKQILSITNKANITVRNFPLSVAELRKKIGINEGGEIYIFATTIAKNNKILIVSKKG